jgi:Na+-translocating ferredoxin:NAD+ oxidoreductase subunit B
MTISQIALNIVFTLLIISGLGIGFGIILAIASFIFAVKTDNRIEIIEDALPGLNCGICGYAGCSAYAESIGLSHGDIHLCLPGGEEVANRLSGILAVPRSRQVEKKVTQVHCRGGKHKSSYDFEYFGLADCNAAYGIYGGDKTCKYGCLGLGSCIRVCPVDAISYDSERLVWVNKDKCIGCGKCIDVCPTYVMRFIPYSADVIVACNSTDKTDVKKKYCAVSCIGCKICEIQSPDGGYEVGSFLARIDYSRAGERENGLLKCPTSCIVRNQKSESGKRT